MTGVVPRSSRVPRSACYRRQRWPGKSPGRSPQYGHNQHIAAMVSAQDQAPEPAAFVDGGIDPGGQPAPGTSDRLDLAPISPRRRAMRLRMRRVDHQRGWRADRLGQGEEQVFPHTPRHPADEAVVERLAIGLARLSTPAPLRFRSC